MADFSKYFPILMQHEGGSKLTNTPGDLGGWTKWGITLKTWLENGFDKDGDGDIDLQDLKLSEEKDAMQVAKKLYWDKIKADFIKNQSIAEFIFDWGYNSGTKTAIKRVQRVLNIDDDGIIGNNTLFMINNYMNQEDLFNKIKQARIDFINTIIKNNPTQEKFRNGWMNRINSFKFKI